jgi:CheY-like chemotaxis protein
LKSVKNQPPTVEELTQEREVAAGQLLCTVSRGEEILMEARAISQRAMGRLQMVLTLREDPDAGAVRPAAPCRRGILLAEDEPALRGLLERVLRQSGFGVWAAGDGLEALDLYHQHGSAIGLVLLDVRMPRLDGPHALAALRQMAPGVRCCFLTGDAGPYSDTELRRLGAPRIFQKPFALDLLTHSCGQLLDAVSRSAH